MVSIVGREEKKRGSNSIGTGAAGHYEGCNKSTEGGKAGVQGPKVSSASAGTRKGVRGRGWQHIPTNSDDTVKAPSPKRAVGAMKEVESV